MQTAYSAYSLPPPYTPFVPSYASTASSSSSSSSWRDHERHSSTRKPDISISTSVQDDSDLKSISSCHSSSTNHSARSHKTTRSNTLKMAIGTADDAKHHKPAKTTRRAKCPPEFLEEIAGGGVLEGFRTRAKCKFRIVAGTEAEEIFEKFVGKLEATHVEEGSGVNKSPVHEPRLLNNPVVFAIRITDAGRKVVDYYMTWRGKIPRIQDHKDRRLSFLDDEFRRVARSLDKYYKQASTAGSAGSSRSQRSSLIVEPSSKAPSSPKTRKSPPSPISVPPPVQQQPEPPQTSGDRDRPVSATSSVISLPLLNMMRNVPFGNRLPLRVTNPDNASIMSDTETTPTATRILETITETAEMKTAVPKSESPTAVESSQQRDSVETRTKGRHRTRSSEEKRKGSRRSSDKRAPDAEEGSPAKRHSSSRRHKSQDDYSSKHSPKHRHRDRKDSDEASEFTIALLDDKLEKSWHGLDLPETETPRAITTFLDSPWTGPLAHSSGTYFYSRPEDDESDDDDDDDDEWEDNYPVVVVPPAFNKSPVIPTTMEQGHKFPSPAPPVARALSYSGSVSNASVISATNSTGGGSLGGGGGGGVLASPSSVVSYRTAFTYPTHQSSPYVPAWINARHLSTPETPVSRLQSPLSYHSGGSPY
ncbi:hypothetical protein AMATHDRAFT_69969 [Amanita thiersii Skay4041]|uniref:Uncharacterized protein n=1 Tax=Amanita thiersii Skay4041 TaxID=703135 RepID=A0A2A9NF60_9AGAR|nr:hypothetical protein AMATHDRAFT_69969 [Amanita thiersii Skay4041]